MGVAVVVISLMGKLDMKSGFTMLGIGLASVGLYLLEHNDKWQGAVQNVSPF